MNNSVWELEAAKMFEDGKSYNEIARLLSIDRHTVSGHLRELGYKTPENKISHNKVCKYDYSYAETVFNKIQTEQSAYWLGFLYADGYISTYLNSISLSLKESDIEHVKSFRSFLKLDNKPLHKKTKILGDNIFTSYEFSFNSAQIREQLIQLGCGPRKSFSLTFPTANQVPKRLLRHFIRGYVDGDGSVTTSSSSKIVLDIAGTYNFLDQYQKWTGLGQNKIHKRNNIYHSMYAGIAAIYILDYLYKDASIYLTRKYEKYLELRRLRLTTVRRPKSMIAELSKKGLTDPDLRLKALVAEATRSSATHSS